KRGATSQQGAQNTCARISQKQRVKGTMETITSPDGITIAYTRSGKGPPLALVHGTAEDQGRWTPILRPLAEHFTIYAIDRRGRNQSGDAEAYSLQDEATDLVA